MRSTISVTAAASVTALVLGSSALAASAAPTSLDQTTGTGAVSAAGGSYIVVLDDGAAARDVAAAHAERFGLDVGHVYTAALQGYSATMPAGAAPAVAALPGVDYVQEDGAVRTDAQTTPTGINRANADASPTARIDGVDQRVNVDVAVVDTGVDLDHPDLNVNTARAKNCSLLGVNADDRHGHGTHVSGTIGALDNTNGVVGMAPGARIWPVKVLTDLGTGLNSDVICGIDYVAAHADEIEVANMSLGGGGEDDGACGSQNDDAMHAAICSAVDAGVTFVVAAGNDSADAKDSTPAAYDEVVTVSALADFNGLPGGGAPSTCTQRPGRHVRVVLQLRRGRRHHRARCVHQQHLDERWLQHDLRHLDGQPARGRRGRTDRRHQPGGHPGADPEPAGLLRLDRLERRRRR